VVFTDHQEGFLDAASIALLDAGTRAIETLFRGGTSPRYSPTGHLLFVRSGSLYAIRFDPERGTVAGTERKLLDGVMTEENGAAQFAVAAMERPRTWPAGPRRGSMLSFGWTARAEPSS
jgi:hypothetical protein